MGRDFSVQAWRRRLREKLLRPFISFFNTEASSGTVLMGATAIALAWANSPWAAHYFELWNVPLKLGIEMSLSHWVNDGLMAVFFFLVGLEIKREVLIGELSSVRKATLPIVAAIGGMAVPALIYALFNASGEGSRGWGIPMATDIAFALGVLSMLGPRVPIALKVFLAAVAIVDDIGAVLVIAIFYSESIQWGLVGIGFAILGALAILNRAGIRNLAFYILPGLVLWYLFHQSGIHATVAGVLLAMTIPARAQTVDGEIELGQTPLERLEHSLQPFVSFLIVPLFAFANAGVSIDARSAASLGEPIGTGIWLGLLLGKPLGILLAVLIAIKSGFASLPSKVGWRQMAGVGILAGIGFTMSLFISDLAFASQGAVDAAKLSIMAASLIAGIIGYGLLRASARPRRQTT